MIHAVSGWIFDLDGTLVDSLPGIAASLNRALETAGQNTHAAQAIRRFIGDGAGMLVRRALPQGSEDMRKHVLEVFRDDYATTWQHGTVPYDGIPELLEFLRNQGVKLAVLSNKPHDFTTNIVETLFPGVFDVVLGQRDGIPHKPDPAGLRQILDSPGWPGTGNWLVGDSVMDIQTARAGGIDAIAVSWGYHDRDVLRAENPARLVDSVAELGECLRAEIP